MMIPIKIIPNFVKVINLITKYIRNNGTYWEFIAELIHLWPEFAQLLNNWREDLKLIG